MLNKIKGFMKDEQGLSTIEYIIGAGVMAGLALLVFTGINGKISGASDKVGDAITESGNRAVGN